MYGFDWIFFAIVGLPVIFVLADYFRHAR